jgi:hypothetical protein
VTFWSYYFAWYTGNVYGNLIASVLTTTLVGALTVLKVRQHLARSREAIRADLAAHHEAVTAHVTAQLAPLHARLGATPPDGGDRA